jgi:hypothetical protein
MSRIPLVEAMAFMVTQATLDLIHDDEEERAMATSDEESDEMPVDEDEDEESNLVELATNYGPILYVAVTEPNSRTPTSSDWLYNVLPKYDDKKLQEVLRMDRGTFNKLVSKIEHHTVFEGKHTPAHVQVAVLLKRLGGLMTHGELAILFGISEGSVELYCTHSITAIIANLGTIYVQWPRVSALKGIKSQIG